MYLIKTILAHPEYIQLRVMKEIANLHNETDLRFDIKGTCSNPEDLYQLILAHRPDLILMDASLLTPCINVAAGFCDIVAITENRSMADSGNIHYSFVPVQPPELLNRIFSIYRGYSEEDLKQREKTKEQYLGNLKLPSVYCSTIDSACLQEHLLVSNGVPPLTQRNMLCSMIENGEIPLERIKIRHPGTQFDPRSTFNPQLRRIIGDIEDVAPVQPRKTSPQNGKSPRPVRLEWAREPRKTRYRRGEPFDFRDGMIRIWYSDASHKEIMVQNNMISYSGSLDTPSTKTIGINVKGLSLPLQITILQPNLTSLKLEQVGRTHYTAGETFQPAGYVIHALFSDGASEPIPFFQYSKKPLEAGTEQIILSYGKFELPIQIQVTEVFSPMEPQQTKPKILEVKLSQIPQKTEYQPGEQIDLTGGCFEVSYEDGTRETVPMDPSMLKNHTLEGVGEQTVWLSFLDRGFFFDVRVYKQQAHLEFLKTPSKTMYLTGEEIAKNELLVKLVQPDGSFELIRDFETSPARPLNETDKEVTIQYQGLMLSYAIHVSNKILVAAVISAMPTKLEYVLGAGQFDPTGGSLSLFYTDSSNETIPMTADMISGFDSSRAGNQVVYVEYQGNRLPMRVLVKDRKLAKVEVITPPLKNNYTAGEELDLTGLRLKAIYDNGDMEEIDNYKTESPIRIEPEQAVVKLQYQGSIFPVFIRVTDAQLVKIEMEKLPDKLSYLEHRDMLKVDGGIVAKCFNNGERELIPLELKMTSGFSNQKTGPCRICVMVDQLQCFFQVEIVGKKVSKISVVNPPEKAVYFEQEPFDPTGMEIKAQYDNQTFERVEGYTIQPEVLSASDTCVTVSFEGQTTTVPIQVQMRMIESISIAKMPEKNRFKEGRDPLDVTGGRLLVLYNNGSADTIDMTEDMIEGFDNMSPGDELLTVRYQDATTQYRIIIEPKVLIGIAVTNPPRKTVYQAGDYFDPTGMVVLGFYDNGRSAEAKHYACQPNGPLTMQDTVITISYLDKMAFVPIEVVDEPIPEPEPPSVDIPEEKLPEATVPKQEEVSLPAPEEAEPEQSFEMDTEPVPEVEIAQISEMKPEILPTPHFYPNTRNLRSKEPSDLF